MHIIFKYRLHLAPLILQLPTSITPIYHASFVYIQPLHLPPIYHTSPPPPLKVC
ncbi:hypothetical protein Hanom_Chr16g01514241 [Helianthus anomalus]